MEKLLVNGVEIAFDDLSSKAQEKLYLQNKEKFQKEAIESKESGIRKLVVKDEECEVAILDEIFRIETEIYKDSGNLWLIWNHPKFQKTDEKKKKLLESDSAEIRKLLAQDKESSSEMLNKLLCNELQNETCSRAYVVDTILDNPKFQVEEETLKVLSKSKYLDHQLYVAKREDVSSELLNEMLRDELQKEEIQSIDIKIVILKNPKLQMEEETLKLLSQSEDWEDRLKVAKCKDTSSELLNKMFRIEIQNEEYQYGAVEEAILNNPKLQMEEKTFKVLAKSENWDERLMAAKREDASSEFLNDMLRNELHGEEDDDVINAILNNSKFNMDDETRKVLVKSDIFDYHKMVIENAGTSKQFLEEMCLNETDRILLDMIEDELFSRISKNTVTLNVLQKKKILKLLKELRYSRKRKPLTKYLEKILEIIG